MKIKHYIMAYAYKIDGEDFMYQRVFSTEKQGKALNKIGENIISEMESSENLWKDGKLELYTGLEAEIICIKEISEKDYLVLVKYL